MNQTHQKQREAQGIFSRPYGRSLSAASNVPPARVESNNKVSGKQAGANGLRTHAHRLLDTRLPCAADLAVRHEVVRLQQQDGRADTQDPKSPKFQGKG